MRRDLKKYQNYGDVMEETIHIVSEDKSLTRVMRKGYLTEIGIPRLTTEELLNETYFYLMSQEAAIVADGFVAAAREKDWNPTRERAPGRPESAAQQFMEEFGSRKWRELMDFLFERPHYIDFQRSYRGSAFYTPENRMAGYRLVIGGLSAVAKD